MSDKLKLPIDGVIPFRIRNRPLAMRISRAIGILIVLNGARRLDRSEVIRDLLEIACDAIERKANRAGVKLDSGKVVAATRNYIEVLEPQHKNQRQVTRR